MVMACVKARNYGGSLSRRLELLIVVHSVDQPGMARGGQGFCALATAASNPDRAGRAT